MKTLPEIIGLMAGHASMCWEPKPTGVFDATEATKAINEAQKAIAKELMGIIGEDEHIQHFTFHGRSDIRDELRKEQRARLTAFIDGVEK